MDVGLLRVGDPADVIELRDLTNFEVMRTWIDGQLVAQGGKTLLQRVEPVIANNFNCPPIAAESLAIAVPDVWNANPPAVPKVRVIVALDGQLVTEELPETPTIRAGQIVADVERDLLKMVLIDRYGGGSPAICLIKNFGLKSGAIASSVSHDSHNILAVGTNDVDLARAVNVLIEARGGISLVDGDHSDVLPLPIAGLMSAGEGKAVAADYSRLDAAAKALGSTLGAAVYDALFHGPHRHPGAEAGTRRIVRCLEVLLCENGGVIFSRYPHPTPISFFPARHEPTPRHA
ncbi:MAG: adenine deaminase C-terminal domain-containing protein [Pirellulales bacterium]